MKKAITIIATVVGSILVTLFVIGMFLPEEENVGNQGEEVHEHIFVDGYCECGEKDPNYKEPVIDDEEINVDDLLPSVDLEEVSDTEAIVHSLIYSSLSEEYDTFLGVITLEGNGVDEAPIDVLGIAYVDYLDAYEDEDGVTYFSSGFISLAGETPIRRSRVREGLEIHSLEASELEDFSYIYGYFTDDLHTHCIINNQYITYDIIDGCIIYDAQDYVEGMEVDITRGNIYNYDTEEFVYIVEEIEYVPVKGVSTLGEADYKIIFDEVNDILRNQESNLSYCEVESYVKNSKDAFISYLLSLQEESFMGVPTDRLITMARDIDPMKHIRLTVGETGIVNYEIIDVMKVASLEEKIIVGSICGVGIVGGIACSLAGNAYAPAKLIAGPIGGALTGICCDILFQVVVDNTPVSDIQWGKVAISAASGAISGLITCGLDEAFSETAMNGVSVAARTFFKEVVDTACDAVIGGTEAFGTALIGGKSFKDACKEFGSGLIMGLIISGGIKLITFGSSAGIKTFLSKTNLDEKIVKIGRKVLTKVADSLDNTGISKKFVAAVKKAATEFTLESVQVKQLGKKLIDQLPSDNNPNFQIVDKLGNVIKKDNLTFNSKAFIILKDTASQEIKDLFVDKAGNAVKRIPIVNLVPQFDELSLVKVSSKGLKSKRAETFKDFDKYLANLWSENNDEIPDFIKMYFINNGIDLDNIVGDDIKTLRAALNLTWHESEDCLSGYLVPSEIHSKISHMGGYSLTKVKNIWECLSTWGKYIYG